MKNEIIGLRHYADIIGFKTYCGPMDISFFALDEVNPQTICQYILSQG